MKIWHYAVTRVSSCWCHCEDDHNVITETDGQDEDEVFEDVYFKADLE